MFLEGRTLEVGFLPVCPLCLKRCLAPAGLCACLLAKLLMSCLTLRDPMDCSLPGSSVHGQYWNGFPCPPPGDLFDPGIEPASLTSPALAGRFFTTSATWEAHDHHYQLSLTPNLSLWSLLSIKFLHISYTLVTPHSLFMVV